MNKYSNHKNNEQIEVKGFGVASESTISGRDATFIISAERMDDDNEIILIEGMDTSDIPSKRRVCWGDHQHDKEVAIIKQVYKNGNKIMADITFPPRPSDLDTNIQWDADLYLAKTKVGYMGASVDFISKERRLPSKKDLEQFPEVELVHSKSKLLGFSLTSLPANNECQLVAIKALKEKQITKDEALLLGVEEKDINEEQEQIANEDTNKDNANDGDSVAGDKGVAEQPKGDGDVLDGVQATKTQTTDVKTLPVKNNVQKQRKPLIIKEVINEEAIKKQIESAVRDQLAKIKGEIWRK